MRKFKFEFSRARFKGGVIRRCATAVSPCYEFEHHFYALCIFGLCICSWWTDPEPREINPQ